MNQNGTTHAKLKVVVIGDAAVGKTSLALRFTKNKIGDTYGHASL
jgi:GTPase SAR1 family protein